MERIPAYRKMYSAIKRNIQDYTYKPGMFLPTESELEAMFNVSRTTVRKAIGMLVSEGFLSVKQGRGTEVVDVSTTQRLNGISSITETLVSRAIKVTTQGMCIERVKAPPYVCEALKLDPDTKVYRVQRVQCADGIPIAIVENYLVDRYLLDLEKHANTFTSLYQFLEKHYNIVLQRGWEYITAISANFTESQILRVPLGTPLLYTKRITTSNKGLFEYSSAKLIAEKYEYSVFLEGRAMGSAEPGLPSAALETMDE